MGKTLSWLLAAAALAWAQPAGQKPRQRDLKYESGAEPAKPTTPLPPIVIPRSYALVVGVANYQNLEAKDQLKFAAEARSTIAV